MATKLLEPDNKTMEISTENYPRTYLQLNSPIVKFESII